MHDYLRVSCRGSHYVALWAIWQRTSAGASADGDEIFIAWARDAYAKLKPYIAGRYLNTVMFDNANDSQLCYEPGVWERLHQVKQKYDPYNLFRELDYYKSQQGSSAIDGAPDGAVVGTSA